MCPVTLNQVRECVTERDGRSEGEKEGRSEGEKEGRGESGSKRDTNMT